MKWLTKQWYWISALLGGLFLATLGIGDFDARSRMVLASMGLIFLHFFEEFGSPGGFP